MPQLLTIQATSTALSELPRKKWNRAEVQILETTGVLDGQHLELIEGELLNKMGKGWLHVLATSKLLQALIELFGVAFVVSEAPIDLTPDDNFLNEPEPDIIVLKRPKTEFGPALPKPEDLHLVVEVANTSLNLDLRVKAGLYARSRIAEYWIVDLNARQLLVMRQPEGDHYRLMTAYSVDENISLLAKPDSPIAVATLLP